MNSKEDAIKYPNKPVKLQIEHLRSGKTFTTQRDDSHAEDLMDRVKEVDERIY